jgi:hypothetical protein
VSARATGLCVQCAIGLVGENRRSISLTMAPTRLTCRGCGAPTWGKQVGRKALTLNFRGQARTFREVGAELHAQGFTDDQLVGDQEQGTAAEEEPEGKDGPRSTAPPAQVHRNALVREWAAGDLAAHDSMPGLPMRVLGPAVILPWCSGLGPMVPCQFDDVDHQARCLHLSAQRLTPVIASPKLLDDDRARRLEAVEALIAHATTPPGEKIAAMAARQRLLDSIRSS